MRKRLRKWMCLFISISLFTISTPITVLGDIVNVQDGNGNEIGDSEALVGSANGTVTGIDPETGQYVEYLVQMDTALFKDETALDAGKVINGNQREGADYRVSYDLESLKQELPELTMADLLELEQYDRHVLTVEAKGDGEYKSRLSYLIENNILSRDTNYIYNNETIDINFKRYLAKEAKVEEKFNLDESQLKHKYYNANIPVSRTDLLVGLMKTEEVKKSKNIFIMQAYKRMDENYNNIPIISEPAIVSPYTDKLGDLGKLTSLEATTIYHDVYESLIGIYTSDVAEIYLNEARNRGIIDDEDLDKSSVDVTDFHNSSSIYFDDSCLNAWSPVRQSYTNIDAFKNKGKYTLIEPEYGTKDTIDYTGGALNPFGNTFSYSMDNCHFSDPYNQRAVQIVKRLSSVEVAYGIKDPTRPEDMGYRFFKNESMSILDAYVLAAKAMQLMGNEQELSESDIQIITSRYALNIEGTTEEELKAVQYLIAQGVINGEDSDLTFAKSKDFTNNEFIKLLYLIDNKEVRYQNMTPITETDKYFSQKGFAQANLHINNEIPVISNEMQFKVSDEKTLDRILADRVMSPNEYDYIYVRLPLNTDNSTAISTMYTSMDGRSQVEPVNKMLNGGDENNLSFYPEITEEDIENTQLSGFVEDSYVLRDTEGYQWLRYIVHKNYSSSIFLQSIINGVAVSFEGINGKGIYYLEDSTDTNFTKISFDKAKAYLQTKDIYKYVIEPDLKIQDYMQRTQSSKNSLALSISMPHNVTLLWSQFAFAAPNTTSNSNAVDVVIAQGTEETLDIKNYNGEKMFMTDSSGNLQIDPGCMDATTLSNYSINPIDVNGEQQYQVIYKVVGNDAKFEAFAEFNKITNINDQTTATEDISGYMKIGTGENAIVLISQEELTNFGIQINNTDKEQVSIVGGKDGTGRLLYNPNTGQRAFINSEDNYTMVGNNITQYKAGEMLVIANDGKIYYNLKIILELLNDTDSVIDRAGKDLVVSLIDANSVDDEYRLIDIYDASNLSVTGEKTIVDRSYIMSNDNFKSIYLSLSALTGYCSNFIYYKSNIEDNLYNVLLVYKPKAKLTDTIKIEDGSVTNYEGSSVTDNGLLSNSERYNGVVKNQYPDKDSSLLTKRLYLQKLLGADNVDSANELIYGDYDLTVYLIGTDTTPETRAATVSKFLNYLASGSNANYKALLSHTYSGSYSYIDMTDYHTALGLSLETISKQSNVVNLNYLACDTVGNAEKNIVLHKSTGNLYYKLATHDQGTLTNHPSDLQNILGQRFYLNFDEQYIDHPDYRKHIFVNFRQYKVYENTPQDLIPLEVYGTNEGRVFNTLETDDGLAIYDFGGTKPYHLYSPTNIALSSNKITESASGHMYGFKHTMKGNSLVDIGYGTTLYLEPVELTKSEFAKLYFKEESKSRVLKTSDEFLDSYLDLVVSKFKTAIPDFPVEKAIGIESTNQVTVGYSKDMTTGSKIELLKGSSAPFSKYQFSDMPKLKAFYGTCQDKPKVLLDVISRYNSSINDMSLSFNADIIVPGNNQQPVQLYYSGMVADDYFKGVTNFIEGKNVSLNNTLDFWDDMSILYTDDSSSSGIWIIPTLTIPAGTTLVDKHHNLIYAPNESIRNEQKVPNNILNTLLLKVAIASGLEEYTYLGQIPEGSIVRFENKFQVVKVSNAQGMSNKEETFDSSEYTYTRCVTDLLDLNSISNQKGNPSLFYEVNLLEQYLTKVANVKVPYNFGITDTATSLDGVPSIYLSSILGRGKYRLPTIAEAKIVLNTNASSLGWCQDVNKYVNLMNTVVGTDGLPTSNTSDVLRYNITTLPISEVMSRTEQLSSGSETNQMGHTALTLEIEPTVVVREAESDGDTKVYDVVNYHDFGSMLFDTKGTFTSYLQSCDTEIPDISTLVSASKVEQYPADNYISANILNHQTNKFSNSYTEIFQLFILGILAFWIYIVFWWLLLKIPVTKRMPETLIRVLTLSVCSVDDDLKLNDVILRTITVSIIIGLLISGGYFLVFRHFVSYL